MSNGYQHVLTSLETRYDFQSARTVAAEALKETGIAEADSFKPAELQKIADVLGASGTNMDSVWLALGVAPSGTAMPAAPVEEAPAEEAPAEDAEEAKEEKKAPAKKKAAKKKK